MTEKLNPDGSAGREAPAPGAHSSAFLPVSAQRFSAGVHAKCDALSPHCAGDAGSALVPLLGLLAVTAARALGWLQLNDPLTRALLFIPLFTLLLVRLHRNTVAVPATATPPGVAGVLGHPALVYLGSISFPIFILHGAIGQMFYKKARPSLRERGGDARRLVSCSPCGRLWRRSCGAACSGSTCSRCGSPPSWSPPRPCRPSSCRRARRCDPSLEPPPPPHATSGRAKPSLRAYAICTEQAGGRGQRVRGEGHQQAARVAVQAVERAPQCAGIRVNSDISRESLSCYYWSYGVPRFALRKSAANAYAGRPTFATLVRALHGRPARWG